MKNSLLRVSAALVIAAGMSYAADQPMWAYGVLPAGAAAPAAPAGGAGRGGVAPDNTPRKLPGSTGEFTPQQIRDGFGPADWFPGDHPPMPEIVAKGRRPEVTSCALCHLPNGKGRPENAGVSGLPVPYFIQQMMDFKNGVRKSAESRKANTARMAAIAKAMTDEESKASAEYFGSMKWTPWIRVVETETVPKWRLSGGLFLPLPGTEKEPIGVRIIEMPEDQEQTEGLRNPRVGFIAYVPPGSIKKGEAAVAKAGCGTCHGADLKGLGPLPGLAGRSPSYLARQMYDFQTGARKGVWSDLMKAAVANLTDADMVNIFAYTASLKP
jgi:cytochrome c553